MNMHEGLYLLSMMLAFSLIFVGSIFCWAWNRDGTDRWLGGVLIFSGALAFLFLEL